MPEKKKNALIDVDKIEKTRKGSDDCELDPPFPKHPHPFTFLPPLGEMGCGPSHERFFWDLVNSNIWATDPGQSVGSLAVSYKTGRLYVQTTTAKSNCSVQRCMYEVSGKLLVDSVHANGAWTDEQEGEESRQTEEAEISRQRRNEIILDPSDLSHGRVLSIAALSDTGLSLS